MNQSGWGHCTPWPRNLSSCCGWLHSVVGWRRLHQSLAHGAQLIAHAALLLPSHPLPHACSAALTLATPPSLSQVCNEGDEEVVDLCADHGCSLIRVPQVRRAVLSWDVDVYAVPGRVWGTMHGCLDVNFVGCGRCGVGRAGGRWAVCLQQITAHQPISQPGCSAHPRLRWWTAWRRW